MNRNGKNTPRHATAGMLIAGLCAAGLSLPGEAAGGADRVAVIATPDGGIQPQAVADDSGVIHLVYFQGDPAAGDLYYVRSKPGTTEFSRPIRVNSQAGSAVAIGTIRGGQLALAGDGRIHVAWNGSQKAAPPNPINGTPMLYTRWSKDRGAFEPQRNLMHRSFYLDGGGSIGADKDGNVFVAWHATSADATPGEAGRRLWIARSRDGGATFADEEPAIASDTGACACCGTKALVDRGGTLYVLYRAAKGNVERDMMLLTSGDHGAHFEVASLEPWRVNVCPMSSEALVDTPSGVLAAWETKEQIAFARIDPRSVAATRPTSPPGGGSRKHPAIAANKDGEIIVVWAEGTGWQRGGALAWRVFDRSGRATSEMGRVRAGIAVWSLPAVVARPDGHFVIIH
jgi:hypothetical protein